MTSIFDLAIFLGGDGVIFQVFFGMAWTGQRDAAFLCRSESGEPARLYLECKGYDPFL